MYFYYLFIQVFLLAKTATAFMIKLNAAILSLKLVSLRDIEATMAPAIIFEILHGASLIQDTEDSYVHVTVMVNRSIVSLQYNQLKDLTHKAYANNIP